MQHFLAALLGFLLSLCHHVNAHPLEANSVQPELPPNASVLPSRYQLAHGLNEPVYAEGVCASCRRINLIFPAR